MVFAAINFGLAGIQMPGVLGNNYLSWAALFVCGSLGIMNVIAGMKEYRP
jgi:hypothetical protein